jgi:hypothetical protein
VRTARLALAAAAVSAAAAGCASSPSASQPSAPPSTVTVTPTPSPSSSSAAAAPAACAASSLRVTLGQGNGYAGGVDVPIVFTNTSAAPCRLFGFPGVSLVSGPSHTQIGLAAKRSVNAAPRLVTLAAGATAHVTLQIVDALNYPPASCAPAKATAVRVYPPNQFTPVYLPTTATGCAKPVQTLYITPVQPGRA